MTTRHRYRVLIYFAALVICLSVCFAFAEEPAPMRSVSASALTTPSSSHLLFSTTPGRARFLPALQTSLIAEPIQIAAMPSADAALRQLTSSREHAHGLLHGLVPSHRKLRLVRQHLPDHLSAANESGNGQLTSESSEGMPQAQ